MRSLAILSTNTKPSKAQISKINQSGGFLCKALGNMVGNLGKKSLLDIGFPFFEDVLPKLVSKPISSVLNKFEKEQMGKNL